MNNNIQCSIESSTTKIELNSAVDGVFLVPELEGLAGLPEIRTTSGVNAGYDGGWTSAQNYDARLISIRGVIANPDISKVEDKRRAIASLLGQGRKEQLTLRFTTEAGNAYAISVRTISCEMALQRVLTTQEFLIQLRADDPLIYDDGATGGIAAILQPQRALGGFEINFELPLTIGGGAEDTVVDNGNETVYPVIKLYGALHSPTVVNRTTNQQMQILADLQYSISWHSYHSATGDYILVNDGLEGATMTLSQLLGNAEQTTYSGKNLLYATELPKTQSNVTATYQDGIFGLSGTSATATNLYILPYTQSVVHLEAGESITMLIERVSGTSKVYFTGYFEPDDASATDYDWGLTLESGANTVTRVKTASKAGNLTHAQMFINANTAYNSTAKILVQKGNIASPTWEPYVGGTPAPNPSFPMPISTVTGAQNIEVVGKNLAEIPNSTFDSFGVLWTAQNGTIAIKGTTTRTSYAQATETKPSIGGGAANYPSYIVITEANSIQLPAGTYTISADVTNAGNVANNKTGLFVGAGQIGARATTTIPYPYLTQGTPSASLTVSEGERVIISAFYEGTSTQKKIDTTISNIQLELGSTATAYEPYQEQSYEVDLGLAGKNMLNPAWMTAGFISVNGTITPNQSAGELACQYFIPVEPNTEYTFEIFATSDTYTAWIGIGEYSTASESDFVTRVTSTSGNYLTFTTASGVHFIRPSARNLQHATEYMLSKGSRTTYEPYFELVKIGTYQDRIYKDEGKWYIEKQVGKVVLDGSESWGGFTQNSAGLWAGSTPLAVDVVQGVNVALANYFTYKWSFNSNTPCFYVYNQSGHGNVEIIQADYSTLDTFKTWLSTHNTTVYYALATPTTTEITDETLRAQLNFLASLYEGVNNISIVGTGAQGEMAISYATDYTVNQDIITIDSQARTITLNGQDVYHLKTSESEFLVLAPGENKLYLTSEVSDDSGYAEVKFKQGYLSI